MILKEMSTEQLFKLYMPIHDKITFSIHDQLYQETASDLVRFQPSPVPPAFIKGGSYMDFGCGTGKLFDYLAPHKPSFYVGVDTEPSAIKIASEKRGSVDKKIFFSIGNALDPIHYQFDGVASLLVAYVTSAPPLLANMVSHLREGGNLVIASMKPNWDLGKLALILDEEKDEMIANGVITSEEWGIYISVNMELEKRSNSRQVFSYEQPEIENLVKDMGLNIERTVEDIDLPASFHGQLFYVCATKPINMG